MKRKVFSLILIPFLLLYAFPAGAVEKEEREWQDETIYFLMVDRFENGDRSNDKQVNMENPTAYQGGDFAGISARLDELKDMGFTTIALTPIFQNSPNGYHGYWITDYYKVEEQLGTMKQFKDLVKEAHERGIRVMIDFPVTHVGTEHPWMKDSDKNEWFVNKQDSNTEEWLGEMPALNLANEETKNYLIQAAKWWIKKTGIDGYYLSNATKAPLSFWEDFSKEIKTQKKDVFLLGEADNVQQMTAYEQAGLDGLTNPLMMEPLRKQFVNTDRPSSESINVLKEIEKNVQEPRQLVNYFDHYKTERFTEDLKEENVFPGTRWKVGLTYLYTIPGIPLVYYGSEIAMTGKKGVDSHRFMSFRADKELIDYITQIGALRQQLPALTRGSFEVLYEKDGMAVFKRQYKDETLIVAVNN
ncbi:MAG TPA: alpha-amylase family glycosyl hydrolase, partial [Chondromyces sp.]|nr:alpha-amylase family glycosyl hydrolase [Chondromyces sp.]